MSQDNPIFWQDEILQMMFWMRGEGLGDVVTIDELNRFLNLEISLLAETVQRLVELNSLKYATHPEENIIRVKLTEQGIAEGKKRFKEEFEGRLGHDSHMVCDDPNCDCHDPDFEGVCHHLIEDHDHKH